MVRNLDAVTDCLSPFLDKRLRDEATFGLVNEREKDQARFLQIGLRKKKKGHCNNDIFLNF